MNAFLFAEASRASRFPSSHAMEYGNLTPPAIDSEVKLANEMNVRRWTASFVAAFWFQESSANVPAPSPASATKNSCAGKFKAAEIRGGSWLSSHGRSTLGE